MAANIQPLAYVEGEGTYSIPIEHGIETASQTYKKGTPLIATSGALLTASANPTAVVGIALANATGVTGADVPFVPALGDSLIFEGSVDGTLVNSDAPGTGKPSDLTVWTTYGITFDPVSGNWYIDSSKSGGNQVLRVIGYDVDQTNVINGRVRFRWLRASSTIYV